MAFFLFLLSILISSFFYFRVSKRFSVFDMELSDDIKRELTALITEFNSSAKNNIEMIEDRIKDSKDTLKQLLVQLEYAKKLKDSLESELKDSYQKLSSFRETKQTIANSNKKALVYQTEHKKSYINNFYHKLGIEYKKEEVRTGNSPDTFEGTFQKMKDPLFQIKDTVEYQKKATLEPEAKTQQTQANPKSLMPEDPNLEQTEEMEVLSSIFQNEEMQEDVLELSAQPNISISIKGSSLSQQVALGHHQSMQETKKEVLNMYKNGKSVDMIASKLHLTKGEVNFMIRLFH